MMDRARLMLLAVCALLTTTIDPFDLDAPSGEVASRVAVGAEAIERSSADFAAQPAAALDERAEAARDADAEVVQEITRRLGIRHTALPERERVALAETIVRQARLHGLEPDLVVAVIEVESAGYHLAVSHVGAMGLMQLLPSTGEELAGKLDIEWMGPDTLFDPTINVRLGTAYLRELADRYDGDVSIALAAYNWGPGRIDRRIRRGATVPSLYIEQVMRIYDRNATVVSRRS